MVCTKLPIGLRRRTAAFCVARAIARGNLMILVSCVFAHQREQAAFVSGADDGVALPVSQTSFARDNNQTLRNIYSIKDQTASSVLTDTIKTARFNDSPALQHGPCSGAVRSI